jgi:FkbH-like protein
MKLIEALRIEHSGAPPGAKTYVVSLSCGFMPLHLKTFVCAYLRGVFPDQAMQVKTGLYGDLCGTIECLEEPHEFALIVIEWPDLDPRLGWRTSGSWDPGDLPAVIRDAQRQLFRLQSAITKLAGHSTVGICLPTLPLPPVSFRRPSEADELQLRLRMLLDNLSEQWLSDSSIALVNPAELDRVSPLATRHDIRAELASGFPYQLPHTDHVARLLVELISPKPRKKGLVTDLDDTVWQGILGDDGIDGISWDLEHHSQLHAIYQQMLNALAKAGVLVAVASNNDLPLVREAFQRADLVLDPQLLHPLEVSRAAKSESIQRILQAWNVAPDSVIFVDDNALELAEVKAAHPEIECLRFPKRDPGAILEFFRLLRDRFGKRELHEEDQSRVVSLQQSQVFHQTAASSATLDHVLQTAEGKLNLIYRKTPLDRRALELINKTNQFNLNGLRHTETSWALQLDQVGSWLQIGDYQDRFARLGKISVIGGWREGKLLTINTWVMSCRAFSRRIEYHCLEDLLDYFGAEEVRLLFVSTERNGPLRDFLAKLAGTIPDGEIVITTKAFREKCPPLYHHKQRLYE